MPDDEHDESQNEEPEEDDASAPEEADDGWSVEAVLREAEKITTPSKRADRATAHRLTAAARRQKVFELKMQGKTLVEIAEIMSLNYNTVQRDFAAVTASIDTTKWLRSRIDGDVQFLDKLISVLSPRALVGDIAAIETILKIMQRQHKILGMEAPKRVDVRVLIQQWAEREGLNPADVADVVSGLLEGN